MSRLANKHKYFSLPKYFCFITQFANFPSASFTILAKQLFLVASTLKEKLRQGSKIMFHSQQNFYTYHYILVPPISALTCQSGLSVLLHFFFLIMTHCILRKMTHCILQCDVLCQCTVISPVRLSWNFFCVFEVTSDNKQEIKTEFLQNCYCLYLK